MAAPLTLLLVDGHPLVRQALTDRLQRHPGIGRVVATDRVAAAIGLIPLVKPDLVICDPRSLGQDIDACVRQLRAAGPPVLVLTSSVQTNELETLRHAGAAEVMLKGVSILDLFRSAERILSVRSGAGALDGPRSGMARAGDRGSAR